MFLNVRRPPFDDVRVRRALNHATDRARVVDLLGGAELAAPSCRIVPAGVAGHEPYCPYGVGSGAHRAWTGPDPERARRQMAASGRAGERVTVWVPKSREALGRYFAGVLDALGLDASVRAVEDDHYFPAVLNPRNGAQIGYANWAADYLTASTFIENFGCVRGTPRTDFNASRSCDPVLDRQIDQALVGHGAAAAERWAAADRRIVDRAVAVPLTNRRTVALVSKRAGNVQQHPQWLALLDQMWVR
jgi:peptide/nickel transport system substrate-binding protein